MKISSYLIALILLGAPAIAVTLSDYPSFFDGKTLAVVVGDNAPASDVAAAITVMNSLAAQGVVHQTVGVARLASEIADYRQMNLIVIGSPCDNPLASQLLGNPQPCELAIPEGKAMIKLFRHSQGTISLLLTARKTEDVRALAKIVADWKNSRFETVSDVEYHLALQKKDTNIESTSSRKNSAEEQVSRPDETQARSENEPDERKEMITNNLQECNGCKTSDTCIQFGVRLQSNKGPAYCDVSKRFELQKQNSDACQNSFECISNTCANSVCTDIEQRVHNLEQEVQEQKSLLQKIVDFISNMLGF